MVFMLILSTIGLAIIYMSGMEEMASRAEIVGSRALYLADGGIELGKECLAAYPGFPEWYNTVAITSNDVTLRRKPFSPFPDYPVSYPDAGTSLQASVSVLITPNSDPSINMVGTLNLQDPRGTGEARGYYTISAIAKMIVGSYPGSRYTQTKMVSTMIFMSTKTWTVGDSVAESSYSYKVVPNSWQEFPSERIMD